MKRGIGILLIVSGIVLILSSFSGITGFAIGEGNSGKIISIIGLVLVAGGLALLVTKQDRELKELSSLVEEAEEISPGRIRFDSIKKGLRYTYLIGEYHDVLKEKAEKEKKKKERNYAQEILDRGTYLERPQEIISLAKQMGFIPQEGYREGTRICNKDGNVITVVPNHRTIVQGTGRGILKH